MKIHHSFLRMALVSLLLLVCGQISADSFKGNRTDFRDETVYFVMTTRFYDGDERNNVLCWDNQSEQISTKDPCWRGDFKGLIEKLDYIKALGFTAIWITPIVQNGSGYDYHGYHAMDFSKVDLRYESRKSWGCSEDVTFQSLIDAAHAKGMKIILDVVFNHTGNFGEDHFCKLFTRHQNIRNQADIDASLIVNEEKLGSDYHSIQGAAQYQRRLAQMKNTDGQNHDTHNYWHHWGSNWNWDENNRWWGQIAGDCVDLNTENPAVTDYLVQCYGEFIKMGVDGFRIDTSGHISRLSFNAAIIPQLIALGEQYKSKRLNECPFYMFGEVCARYSEVTYRGHPNLSPYYYTWKSDASLMSQWNSEASWWDAQVVPEGSDLVGNMALCVQEADVTQESNNAFLVNSQYHAPDYSKSSGFNVIDFPMHYNFTSAGNAVNIAKSGDKYYNDATYNLVYIDSHDYGPQPNDQVRFGGSAEQWAENLSLMFTFRGIPCMYYGSEVEFQKGKKIDNGPNGPLSDTGRAYFGGNLAGSVTATDFGVYTASGKVASTLNHDLAQHVRRLNLIRAAVPALRRGQYTFDGCSASGGYAFKRATADSYALVCINGGATFSNCPNGTYTDIITGQTYSGTTITVSAPTNKGQLRVLVKDWTGGTIGEDGKFIYKTSAVAHGGTGDIGLNDSGATFWWGPEDAVGTPAVTFNPAGGAFRTETLTVTASLNESSTSGWYKVGNGSQVSLTAGSSKQFTIGSDMNYGQEVTVSWSASNADGDTYTGSAVYKKVDPNAAITIYCKASAAPYLYAWDSSNKKLNGDWPGKQMTSTTVVDGETFYYQTFIDVESMNIIFNNGGSSQTADITGITSDAYFTYDGGSGYTLIDGGSGGGGGGGDQPVTSDRYAFFVNTGNWSTVNVWVWLQGGDGKDYLGVSWPGKKCTKLSVKFNGYEIWEWAYDGTVETMPYGILFNNGSGTQTSDFSFENGGFYNASGKITNAADIAELQTLTAIDNIYTDTGDRNNGSIYSIDGRKVADSMLDVKAVNLPRGIYIHNGRKFVVR